MTGNLPPIVQTLLALACRILDLVARVLIRLFPGLKGPLHELGGDRTTIVYHHLLNFGRLPRLEDPRTYAEKMSWLKLNHVTPLMRSCSDKLLVRDFVRGKGLEDLVVPILAEYGDAAGFETGGLPEAFVIKANHGSSFYHICRDRDGLDVPGLRRRMDRWLASDFSRWFAETNYRGIVPKLLVEPYLPGAQEMVEFKFLCFHGEPRFVSVITSRRGGTPVRGVYDMNWRPLDLGTRGLIRDPRPMPRPAGFDAMVGWARRLSEDFLHVRVDLMLVGGRVYFSELTFYNLGGFGRLEPEEANELVGSWLDLSREPEYRARGEG